MKEINVVAIIICIVLVTGCTPGPEPISYGEDQCEFCRMTISNPKYGAELVTEKGRVLKYDAAECLVNHLQDDAPAHQMLLAIAYDEPKKLYPVDSLTFVISVEYRSPMGAHLAGFLDAKNIAESAETNLLTWNEVVEKLRK